MDAGYQDSRIAALQAAEQPRHDTQADGLG